MPVRPASNGIILKPWVRDARLKLRWAKRPQKITNRHTTQAISVSFYGPGHKLSELRSQKWSSYTYAGKAFAVPRPHRVVHRLREPFGVVEVVLQPARSGDQKVDDGVGAVRPSSRVYVFADKFFIYLMFLSIFGFCGHYQ